jgi:methionine-rich copper-binding protein CopC
MRRIAKACAAAVVGVASNAFAHAFLDHAVPGVGSTVQRSPQEVRAWFTEALEPAFSSIKVEDTSGRAVAAADKGVDATDHTLLRVALPPLPPGRYRVVWRVISVDSHATEGDFTFDVAPR